MINVLSLFIWGALLLNAGLGASVYAGNRHRLVNKFYLLLSLVIACWLYTSLRILHGKIKKIFPLSRIIYLNNIRMIEGCACPNFL